MVLGFSVGELVLILGVGAWAFGPKELPRVGRTLGRLTGKATGFLYRTRSQMFRFAEDTEVTKLHQEVQATMHQLNAIREELRGGINFMNPGPLAQRTLRIRPVPGQGVIDPYAEAAQNPTYFGGQVAGLAAPVAPAAEAAQQLAAAVAMAAPSFAAAPYAAAAQQATPSMQLGPTVPATSGGAAAAQGWGEGVAAGAADEGDGWRHPEHLEGISAVAAGLAPERSQGMPTGSDIVLDALMEEMVARQVAAFMQQQQQQQQAQQAQQQQRWGAQAGQRTEGAGSPGPGVGQGD